MHSHGIPKPASRENGVLRNGGRRSALQFVASRLRLDFSQLGGDGLSGHALPELVVAARAGEELELLDHGPGARRAGADRRGGERRQGAPRGSAPQWQFSRPLFNISAPE